MHCNLSLSVPNVRVAHGCSLMHGKGIAMNTKVLSVLVVLTVLPMSVGCGNICGWLHGRGAYCGSCAANGPGYTVVPPAAGPLIGGHTGCGTPQCPPLHHHPEPVCGTELGGAYYGGYDAGYPIDESVIGSPVIGNGIYDAQPYDRYSPPSGFMPNGQSYIVPGSQYEVEGTPLAPMQPTPLNSSSATGN